AGEELAQLGELALARGLGGARGARLGEGDRVGVDLEAQAGREAGGAQEAQRVLLEAPRPDRAQDATLEVGEAAVRVDRLARGERHGDGADGEVALREVGLDRVSAQGGDIDLPAARRGHEAPGTELGGEL